MKSRVLQLERKRRAAGKFEERWEVGEAEAAEPVEKRSHPGK